jgi:Tfp pilus assembly protein PilV
MTLIAFGGLLIRSIHSTSHSRRNTEAMFAAQGLIESMRSKPYAQNIVSIFGSDAITKNQVVTQTIFSPTSATSIEKANYSINIEYIARMSAPSAILPDWVEINLVVRNKMGAGYAPISYQFSTVLADFR